MMAFIMLATTSVAFSPPMLMSRFFKAVATHSSRMASFAASNSATVMAGSLGNDVAAMAGGGGAASAPEASSRAILPSSCESSWWVSLFWRRTSSSRRRMRSSAGLAPSYSPWMPRGCSTGRA
uniref:Putative secreted protein n=1 Tax=Ixodes ricinus TaxID=34613 RepID=A0A6B0UPS9_IXORI